MLTHCNNIIPFSSSTFVNHSSFHSGTEWADWILDHAFFCSFHDSIWLYPIRNAKWFHIWNQWLRFILIYHRVHRHSTNLKFYRGNRLEIFQNMDHCQWVFASTYSNEHFISFINHFKISDCWSNLIFNIIWDIY